jgi:hypothetical protein
MITFGGAADEQSAYFGLRTGGVAAVQLTNGDKRWFTPIERAPGPGPKGQTAAITAAPGVIFSDAWDGVEFFFVVRRKASNLIITRKGAC